MAHALGLAAYPREGGNEPTYYRGLAPALDAFVVDDEFAFMCVDNAIVRISLTSDTREALTHDDCASSHGLGAVLSLDESHVYYLGVPQVSHGARPVEIRRIARDAPGAALPAAAD